MPHYQHKNDTYTINVRHENGVAQVSLGEAQYPVQVRHLADGLVVFEYQGRQYRAYVVQQGRQRHVAFQGPSGGQSWTLEHLPSLRKRRQVADISDGTLAASMPGAVLEVSVSVGDEVSQGSTLVLLEAMKMELRVKAPFDGVVKQVQCAVGQIVERGQVLVELEVRG